MPLTCPSSSLTRSVLTLTRWTAPSAWRTGSVGRGPGGGQGLTTSICITGSPISRTWWSTLSSASTRGVTWPHCPASPSSRCPTPATLRTGSSLPLPGPSPCSWPWPGCTLQPWLSSQLSMIRKCGKRQNCHCCYMGLYFVFSLKETMRVMGLGNSVHWLSWFIDSFSVMFISCVLLTIILVVWIAWYFIPSSPGSYDAASDLNFPETTWNWHKNYAI